MQAKNLRALFFFTAAAVIFFAFFQRSNAKKFTPTQKQIKYGQKKGKERYAAIMTAQEEEERRAGKARKKKMEKLSKMFAMAMLSFALAAGAFYCTPSNAEAKAITIVCHHRYTYKKTAKYPTCTRSGKQKVICRLCGKTVKTVKLEKKGHSWDPDGGAWATKKNGKKAYYEKYCWVCGAVESPKKTK